MKSIISAAAAAVVASATFASASMLEISGGVGGTIPDGLSNEVLADMGIGSLGGYFGSQVSLSGPTQTLRIELLGFEAGNANQFEFQTNVEFDTETFAPTDTVLPSTGPHGTVEFGAYGLAGVLEFLFRTDGAFGPGGPGVAENGSNPDNSVATTPNFFASFGLGQEDATSGRHLYLFFDDGGAGDDDNHDDLVIRISAVPLPMSGLLLLAGLGGLGVASRRRKS